MTPAMIAALVSKRKSVTGLFEIDLPSGTKRMMLGSGELIWGANTFKGYDSSFGSIIGGDGVAEDATGQAPNTSFTLQVSSSAVKADIASAAVQLARVQIWLAAIGVNGSNHFIAVADPELLFDGFIDQATSSVDKKKDQIDYALISGFDYFFEDSEGQRLSSSFHHTVWPVATDEKGLDNVTGVTRKVYWGTYGPGGASGVTSSGGSSGYVGGGYGGGGGIHYQ